MKKLPNIELHNITDYKNEELLWIQKGLLRNYKLVNNNVELGYLYYKNILSSNAIGKTSEGEWLFEIKGNINPRICIFQKKTQRQELVIETYYAKAEMNISYIDNKTYKLRLDNYIWTKYVLLDQNDKKVATIKMKIKNPIDIMKNQCYLKMEPEILNIPLPSFLLLIVWYLVLHHQEDPIAAVFALLSKRIK